MSQTIVRGTILLFAVVLMGVGCTSDQSSVINEQQKQIEELTKKVENLIATSTNAVPIIQNTSTTPIIKEVKKPFKQVVEKKAADTVKPIIENAKPLVEEIQPVVNQPVVLKIDPQILIEQCKVEMEKHRQSFQKTLDSIDKFIWDKRKTEATNFCTNDFPVQLGVPYVTPEVYSACIKSMYNSYAQADKQTKQKTMQDFEISLQNDYLKCISK